MATGIMITLSPSLFYFLFFSLFSHQIMSQPHHMSTFCNHNDFFTKPSAYETNRNLVLSFLCRGDLNQTTCSNCVQTATFEIVKNCTLNKEAFIYYKECMVRYSDSFFFSKLEVLPNMVLYSVQSAPDPNGFNQTLSDKFNQLILNVSSSPSSPIPYFVEDEELVTHSDGSYELSSLLQCSPDLDPFNCAVCLRFAFGRVSTCCGLSNASIVFVPKCLLAYSTSLLSSSPPSSPLSPPPLFMPPQSPSQTQSPPLVFTPPQNVPSGSFSSNIVKGNEVFGRIIVTVTAFMFALVDM